MLRLAAAAQSGDGLQVSQLEWAAQQQLRPRPAPPPRNKPSDRQQPQLTRRHRRYKIALE